MKIADYKKRAAQAAAEWLRLQAEKNSNANYSKEIDTSNINKGKETVEESISELVDELALPETKIKGIKVLKKELRDIA